MAGTGKGNIQQVQIIHYILQMLMMIIRFIDRLHHGFCIEVYRYEGQFIEWLFLWLTPDSIHFFQFPVAERHDYIIKFQSFTLMDSDKSDSVNSITMNTFLMNGIVPFLEKGIYIAAVVYQIFVHPVIEGTDISALFLHILYLIHPQGSIKNLCKLKERFFQQGRTLFQ